MEYNVKKSGADGKLTNYKAGACPTFESRSISEFKKKRKKKQKRNRTDGYFGIYLLVSKKAHAERTCCHPVYAAVNQRTVVALPQQQ